MNTLRIGSRIRLRVRTLSGWKGNGTVTAISGNTVTFTKENVPDQHPGNIGYCHPDEAEVIRDLIAGDRIRIRTAPRTGGPLYGRVLEDVRNNVVLYRGDDDPAHIIRRSSRDEVALRGAS